MTDSKIYLGADGNYHDDTEENRDRFPAPESTGDLAADAVPEGEPVPFTESGEIDGEQLAADTVDSGTVVEAGSEATPEHPEPAADPAPKAEAKTRKA